MLNLAELLKKDVSGFFPHKQQGNNIDSDKQFSRLETSGRIISSWCGILPSTGGRARHILRAEHLRELPGERLQPYRAQPNFTHQIWLWYRLNDHPERLYLLFRGQFDFTIGEQNGDLVAAEITEFLASILMDLEPDSRELYRHKFSDQFWTSMISKKFEYLKYML